MAFFTNALTADQVQGLYGSLGASPALSTQPATGRVVNGGSGAFATFAVTAGGSSPLAYQWYFNASSNYSGATRLTDDVRSLRQFRHRPIDGHQPDGRRQRLLLCDRHQQFRFG